MTFWSWFSLMGLLFFAAMTAGGLLMVEIAVIPTVRRVRADLRVRVHLAVDHYIEYSMPAFTVITAVFAILATFLGHLSRGSTTLIIIGFICTLLVAFISHFFNRRINQSMRRWPTDSIPLEYPEIRIRWNRLHAARTTVGVVAMICFIIAYLAR